MGKANKPGARSAPTRPAPVVAPTPATAITPRRDVRRWIYGGLDTLFVVLYAVVIWFVIPNRLPSAAIHLWMIPLTMLALAIGTFVGGPRGWWIAIVGGSALLLVAFLLIVRILISAAFLAGVYGAFGKAASSFTLIAILLVIELVVLLPLVQVRYLNSRAGRRTFGRL